MADARRYALSAQLDIRLILLEAQHRWLRPAEICEILQNYKKFQINPDPPNRPSSGSLFLFDRKVLRYFRKDGHNWRKKRDGKTVKEAHERLKCGSVDVLHCYYAHGEDNENFQRRSYWMLEEELSHIVLVHYRQVEGNGTNYNRIREPVPNIQRVDDNVTNSDLISSSASLGNQYGYHVTSQITDTSAPTSEYEDAESAYTHQTSSGFHTFLEVQPPLLQKVEARLTVPNHVASSSNYHGQISAAPDLEFTSITLGDKDQNAISSGLTYRSGVKSELPAWGNALGNWRSGVHPVSCKPLHASSQANTIGVMHQVANGMLGQVLSDTASQKQGLMTTDGMQQWQGQVSEGNLDPSPMDQKLNMQSVNFSKVNNMGLQNPADTQDTVNSSVQNNIPAQFLDTGRGLSKNSVMNSNPSIEGKSGYSTLRQPLLDGVMKEGLQKLDSFDRWMSRELGDVNESHIQTSSGANWVTDGNEDGMSESNIASQVHLDTYTLSPSLSQDQLFSILDFSPNWAYSDSKEKVLITGKFLKSQIELGKYQWACMFGELEVPAEVIGGGVIRCHTPKHEVGRVPFYVTCSNRLACSEVREFEFRVRTAKDEENFNTKSMYDCRHLVRFGKLLAAGFNTSQIFGPNLGDDNYNLRSNIETYLKKEDYNEWEHLLNFASDKLSIEKVKDHLTQKLLKNQLHLWLLWKHAECDKGPNVLDDSGQGVLHLAAALGYDWAIEPIIVGGVSVDFRDLNGWTALHWAAFYGRERTVASLISLGASPGALTDPTPRYPAGRAPADLASNNGHKGIAGYLAESTLSSHLILLKLKDNQNSLLGEPAGEDVQTASERTATPIGDGDLAHGVSLKDSLAALRNATQAAARIHQVFRLQSFQKKQMKEYGNSELSISDGRALSHLSGKTKRAGIHDEPVHAAATRIQNKFRSWKGRREYLRNRQRIIKIQAHVRGHQVRKNYKKITWSVGILEKIILRWRRKGSGLRGYKPEAPSEETKILETSSTADEYDFLKEGRKQTEERLQKALTRVKSMVQYPEARDQYRRLLNVVSEMQSSKGRFDKVLNDSDETVDFDEDLIDLDALLYDDPLLCI